MRTTRLPVLVGCCWIGWVLAASTPLAADLQPLNLIPFPKEVEAQAGNFALNRRLVLEINQSQAQILGDQIRAEFVQAGYAPPIVRPVKTSQQTLCLSTRVRRTLKKLPLRDGAGPEEYALQVQPDMVLVSARTPSGLFYGGQTLCQLIRANRHNHTIPALSVRDWPALEWRAFQDDLTRGPSSTLQNLQQQVALGAYLKLNLFTYYMEHQFAFQKHPVIGPKDGSLTSEELTALVAFAQPLRINILGNQQSFGHFTAILAHPEYEALRETPYLLCPTTPRTYRLLDDLYSEVAPLLPFPFFNVCCDETDGLGEGPSKPLASAIGPGALYVEHIRRIHDLIANKYHKRMMMWGDIILRHPDQLHKIPKDTVMLTWGYDPRASFDEQITPFAKAGYDFLVCPGANGWNRILPAFGPTVTNIQNFVRDGLRFGARGMLNTAWDDDGETFNAPNWHAFAWGAECAWSGSKTRSEDFQRRLGAVIYGENGDAFGRAIQSLMTPGIDGVPNSTFWKFNFGPVKVRTIPSAREQWETNLKPIRQAIADLRTCQKAATTNGGLLDYFLFGAQRLELCMQRELDRMDAALLYRQARRSSLEQALPLLQQIEVQLRANRDAHAALGERFAELWSRENKPYALDWTRKRYHDLAQVYETEIADLARVRLAAKPDRSLPTPREVGLELIEEPR